MTGKASQLVETLEALVKTNRYSDALVNLNTLFNFYAKDLKPAELITVFTQSHAIASFLFQGLDGLNKVTQFYEDPKTGLLQFLSNLKPEEQIKFYLTAGDGYAQQDKYDCWIKAVYYYTRARQLIQYLHKTTSNEQKELQPCLLRLKYIEVTGIVNIQLKQTLEKPLEIKQQVKSFITLSQSLQEIIKLSFSLTIAQPFWLPHYLTLLENTLNRSSQIEPLTYFHEVFAALQQLIDIGLLSSRTAEWIKPCYKTFTESKAKNIMTDAMKEWLATTWIALCQSQSHSPSTFPVAKLDFSLYHQLQNAREQFRKTAQENKTDVLIVQQDYTKAIKQLWATLFRECETLAGKAPCDFAILGMGSLARQGLGLASDLDFAILVQEEKYQQHDYFQQFIQLIQLKLNCLGDGYLLIDETDLSYFKKDNQLSLLNTPEGLLKNYHPSLIIEDNSDGVKAYDKHRPVLLYPDNTAGQRLAIKYQTLLWQNLQKNHPEEIKSSTVENKALPLHVLVANYYFKFNNKKLTIYQNSNVTQEKVNLKNSYLTPLLLWCADVALYYGITREEKLISEISHENKEHQSETTVKVLETALLPILNALTEPPHLWIAPEFIAAIRRAFVDLQQLRLRQHSAWMLLPRGLIDIDEFAKPHSALAKQLPQELVLTEAEEQRLEQIDSLILQPLQQAISVWTDNELASVTQQLFDPAFFNLKIALSNKAKDDKEQEMKITLYLQALAKTAAERQLNSDQHIDYYQRVPEVWREAYRSLLSNALKGQPQAKYINELMSSYPLKSEKCRPCTEDQTKAWDTVIREQLTTHNQKSDAQNTVYVEWWNTKNEKERRFLLPSIQAELFNDQGLPRNEKRHKLEGQHLVIPILMNTEEKHSSPIAYAKFFPEMPGIQTQTVAAAQQISGYGLQCRLVRMVHSRQFQGYPVLLSKPAGESLQSIAKRKLEELDTIQKLLDPRSFTLKFLESIILSYEDERPVNVTAEQVIVDSLGNYRYRLVGIDSDHAFQPALVAERFFGMVPGRINLKSILFFFDQMKKPLDPHAIAEFLMLDSHKMLKQLFDKTCQYDDQIIQYEKQAENLNPLFSHSEIMLSLNKKIPGQTDRDACVLPAFFNKGTFTKICLRIQIIQIWLKEKQHRRATHLELFSYLEPEMASYYTQLLFKLQPNPLRQILKHILSSSSQQSVDIQFPHAPDWRAPSELNAIEMFKQSTKAAAVHNNVKNKTQLREEWNREFSIAFLYYHDHSIIKATSQEIEQGKLQTFLNLAKEKNTDLLLEKIINHVNFFRIRKNQNQDKAHSIETEILKALSGRHFYRLRLAGCLVLTDNKLESFLKNCPHLYWLNLNGCQQLTNVTVNNIAKYRPNIEYLDLRDIPKLSYIGPINSKGQPTPGYLSFPKLKKLFIDEHRSLIFIKTPAITRLIGFAAFLKQIKEKLQDIKRFPSNASSIVAGNSNPLSGENDDFLIKILLLGSGCPGKSSLLHRYCNNELTLQYGTMGVDFKIKRLSIANKSVKLHMWDTTSNSAFNKILSTYLRDASIVLLCHDITQDITEGNTEWLFKKELLEQVPVLLVGTKNDLPDKRVMPYEQGIILAKKYNFFDYLECSAKTGEGVKEVFTYATFIALASINLIDVSYLEKFVKTLKRPERSITIPSTEKGNTQQNDMKSGQNPTNSVKQPERSITISSTEKINTQQNDMKSDQNSTNSVVTVNTNPLLRNSYDFLIKIILIDSDSETITPNSGKSSLLHRYCDNEFTPQIKTHGVNLRIKTLSIANKSVKLNIWDPGNYLKCHSLIDRYVRSAHIVLLCHDLTTTLMEGDSVWFAKKELLKQVPVLLVGTKNDLEDERIMTYEASMALVKKYNFFDYLECSAKTGEGVKEIFTYAALMALVSRKIIDVSHLENFVKALNRLNSSELISTETPSITEPSAIKMVL